MKRVKILAWVLGIIVWLVIGFLIARGPQPELVVPGEKLWQVGPLKITNTLFTAWISMIIIIAIAYFGTRSMKLLPSGFQNFIEAGFSYVLDQIVEIAGDKNGRRFFTLTATIFFFICIANWIALLPVFNAIGVTEDVGHEVFHELSSPNPDKLSLASNGTYKEDHKFAGTKLDNTGGVYMIKSGAKSMDFTVNDGETPAQAADRYYVFLATKFTDFKLPAGDSVEQPQDAQAVKAAVAALNAEPKAPHLITANEQHGSNEHGIESSALGTTVTGVDFSKGQRFGTVIPLFRSAFADVSNTLAIAIISFVMVEFWGIQSLGIGYLKKFFDFSSPINFFVGFLELISEFVRIISFTFRLFGNLFGGEVLIVMITYIVPFLLVDIVYGMELFFGFIQAAIFALLTLVFAVMATESHGEEGHAEGSDGHHTPEHGAPGIPQGAAQVQ